MLKQKLMVCVIEAKVILAVSSEPIMTIRSKAKKLLKLFVIF